MSPPRGEAGLASEIVISRAEIAISRAEIEMSLEILCVSAPGLCCHDGIVLAPPRCPGAGTAAAESDESDETRPDETGETRFDEIGTDAGMPCRQT